MADRGRGLPELTLLDRAIGYLDPVRATKRLRARAAMALYGQWTGASRSRRSMSEWNPLAGDADSDDLLDLPILRARSRDATRNIPLARAATAGMVTGVVGSGLKLQASVDREVLGLDEDAADAWERAAEREFRLWACSPNCDAARGSVFVELQAVALQSVLASGDCFAILGAVDRSTQGWPYRLAVQLVEADRVSNPDYRRDDEKIAGGIERDPETGSRIACYIARTHPGDRLRHRVTKWDRRELFGRRSGRPMVLHVLRRERIGQSRGVPFLAPVLESLKQLGRYTDAELSAAVVASFFTVFVKSGSGDGLAPMQPTSETGGATTDNDYKMGPAAMLALGPDESVETANPGRPNDKFDPFVMAVLRQIGAALEIPFEVLLKHFSASYSASKAAIEQAWLVFSERRAWLARTFCQPIYEAVIEEAVATGRLEAPGFFEEPLLRAAWCGAQWVGDAKPQIDETKAVTAAKERIALRVSTRAREAAQMTGDDWERVTEQLGREERKAREAGLSAPPMGAAAPPPAPAPVDDDPEDPEGEDNPK